MTHPTSTLVVPATQNTAPVLDFRCLYTHDLRRKQKRWQDGIARFHTFNKRLMVYDESRNFVGDTHWRESDPVQDGDELQLDKGVLIQIGEETARAEQDLTELLERRKRAPIVDSSAAESMPNPTPHSESATPNPGTSALRPKSLNVLLGTPKGRIGRAAIPQKSPFEVRRTARGRTAQDQTATADRPAKRPRLQADSNATVARESQIKTTLAVVNQVKNTSAQQAGSVREQLVRPSEQTQRSAAQVPPRAPRVDNDGIQASTLGAQVSRNEREQNDSRKIPKKLSKTSSSSNTGSVSNNHDIGNVSGKPNEVTQRKRPQASTSSRPTTHSPPPASHFRIASGKPRKKLMYKELLPKAAAASVHGSPSPTLFQTLSDDQAPTKQVAPDLLQAREEDSSSQYHHDQRERIRKRLRKHERKKPVELDDEELAAMQGTDISNVDAETRLQTAARARNTKEVGTDREAPIERAASIPDLQQHEVLHLSEEEEEEELFCTQNQQLGSIDHGHSSGLVDVQSHQVEHGPDRQQEEPATGNPPAADEANYLNAPRLPTIAPLQPPPPSPSKTRLPPPPPTTITTAPLPTPRGPLQRSHTVPSSVVARAQRTALQKSLSDAAKAQPRDDDAVSKRAYTKEAVALKPEPWSHGAWELFGVRREDVVRKVQEREKRRKNEDGEEKGTG